MRVIIHGGMPKTGSSAIQQYLHDNRERLTSVGLFYPEAFGRRSQWLLTPAFGEPDETAKAMRKIDRRGFGMSPDEARARFSETLASFTGDVMLLSHEGMTSNPSAKNLIRFIRHQRTGTTVNMVAYIRNPVSHFVSSTQQHLKKKNDRRTDPSTWISSHCSRGMALLRSVPRSVKFRVFDHQALLDGDVVSDFRAWLQIITGLELPPVAKALRNNISYSGPACSLLATLDVLPGKAISGSPRDSLLSCLRQADKRTSAARLSIPDSWKATIEANNAAAWNQLVDVTEHDDETKARYRIEPPTSVNTLLVERDTSIWATSQVDPAYNKEVLRLVLRNAPEGDRDELQTRIAAVIATTSPKDSKDITA